jgi:hypothetical protein
MLASTKSAAVPPHKVLRQVEAKDCATIYNPFLFIPIISPANFKNMYNNVLEQAKGMEGDAVIDFQVRETSVNNVLFLYMRYCYSAVGTVVKFTDRNGTSVWDVSPSGSEGTSVWDALPTEKQEIETKSVWD